MPKNKQAAPSLTVPRFWDIVTAEDSDEAEITMYGDVVDRRPVNWFTGEEEEGQFITPEGFAEDLARIKSKARITIRLNSVGGDAYTAIAIHNALKALPAEKIVIVEGIAASAASIIMCAGDKVQVYPGSMVMVHGAKCYLADFYSLADVKKVAKMIDTLDRAMAIIYSKKTGMTEEAARALVNAETWMTGQQAVDKGFADELLDGAPVQASISADKRVLIVAGIRHDIRAFHNIPQGINIATDAAIGAGGKNNEEEASQMTEQELREQYPELVESIVARAEDRAKEEAAQAERARIRDIESIEAQIADKEMVDKAKYGSEGMTAAALALAAMQQQAVAAKQFKKDLAEDAAKSGAKEVVTPANGGYDGKEEADDASVIASAKEIYKKMRGEN